MAVDRRDFKRRVCLILLSRSLLYQHADSQRHNSFHDEQASLRRVIGGVLIQASRQLQAQLTRRRLIVGHQTSHHQAIGGGARVPRVPD